ncbi:hypothetical protein Peur_040596 [Populus x canadensis]
MIQLNMMKINGLLPIYMCVCVCVCVCKHATTYIEPCRKLMNSQHIQISKRCPSPVTQIQRAFMKAWPKTKFFKTVPITNMHSFSKPRN